MPLIIVFAGLILVLAACDSKHNNQNKESSIEKAISTQLDSLGEATSVEQKLQENAEKRRQQIEQRGG